MLVLALMQTWTDAMSVRIGQLAKETTCASHQKVPGGRVFRFSPSFPWEK